MKAYYSSSHWKKFRLNLTDSTDCSCEICGRPRWAYYKVNTKKHKKGDRKRLLVMTVHHKTYETLGKEKLKDVMVLCRMCHEFAHTLQRLSVMAPDVYLNQYDKFKIDTDWDYTKRPK